MPKLAILSSRDLPQHFRGSDEVNGADASTRVVTSSSFCFCGEGPTLSRVRIEETLGKPWP